VPALLTASPGGGTDLVAADNLSGNALQGAYTNGYARMLEIWVRIEAGQLDRARVLAADLSKLGERHGFDVSRVVGATWQAAVGGLGALGPTTSTRPPSTVILPP
jgi:hypothetical protein